MTNNEFFELMDEVIKHCDFEEVSTDEFEKKYNEIKEANISKAKKITEKGILIVNFMKENESAYNNTFSAAMIGEGIDINPKSVSGSMRKLINDGYCTKTKGSPTCYHLEDKGRAFELE